MTRRNRDNYILPQLRTIRIQGTKRKYKKKPSLTMPYKMTKPNLAKGLIKVNPSVVFMTRAISTCFVNMHEKQ